MSLDKRVMELETRLAFQDDTIQTLNDVLVKQQRQMERLKAQMAALIKRQEEMATPADGFGEDLPPPHY